MDTDSPPQHTPPLKPRDRVVRRLVKHGVPKEYLDRFYPGIVAFAMENKSSIPELVSSILPTYEEVAESINAKDGVKKTSMKLTMKIRFRECMTWLQWLMFESDPADTLKNLAIVNVGQRGVCGSVWVSMKLTMKNRFRECMTWLQRLMFESDPADTLKNLAIVNPTCVICVPCLENGDHKDHDYSSFYTGGGCCDCGDVTAWKREGFCSKHKGTEQIQPLEEKFANSAGPVLDALFKCWKNKLSAAEIILRGDLLVTSGRLLECRKYANEVTYAIVEMLLDFCKLSESLLSFISTNVISSAGLLEYLVSSESYLSKNVTKKLHELLLKLLVEPSFKYEFAKEFLKYYPTVVNEAIKKENDILYILSNKKYPLVSTFSVQIFTVTPLTLRLVKEENLLATLFGCLGNIFVASAGEDGRLETMKWRNFHDLTIRVVKDIEFVISLDTVSRYIIHEQRALFRTWARLLAFVQGMESLHGETEIHVCRSIGNIHCLLVGAAFDVSRTKQTDDEALFNMSKQDIDDGDNLRHANSSYG